eukprot:TRINITY_DN7695_c0_g1_i1.p1 TRINITY_DN7695_c0_g1~~TRINITY_DN7695_c0_g1_i1.p1  ORF type:complete len:435 (+),score=45.84 TRINITY_DN7695_c0_g1_i1:129-1433(+)
MHYYGLPLPAGQQQHHQHHQQLQQHQHQQHHQQTSLNWQQQQHQQPSPHGQLTSAPFRICYRCDQHINNIAECNDDGRGHFMCNACAGRLSAASRICYRCDQPINRIAECNDDGRGHFLCNACAGRLSAANSYGTTAVSCPFRICYRCDGPIHSVAETADDGQGHFLCHPCAAMANRFVTSPQGCNVVQKPPTEALAEQYQSIMAELVLAMNKRDRAEADRLVSDLAKLVKVVQDTCGWETMDAHLASGPFTRAARQMVSAKYRNWCDGELDQSSKTFPTQPTPSTPVPARLAPALHGEQPAYAPCTTGPMHPNMNTHHARQQAFVPSTASTDMASSHLLQSSLTASTDPFETQPLPVHSGSLPCYPGALESNSKMSGTAPTRVQQHRVSNPAPTLLRLPGPTRADLTWQSMPSVLLENWGSWEELEWDRLMLG